MNPSPCMPHVDESTRRQQTVRNLCIVRALTAAGLVASLTVAQAQNVAEKNGLLTDAGGKTLYTLDEDSASKSNCAGGCVAAWPPFFASEPPKDNAAFTRIMRDDGRMQWARDGKPLYFFAGDGQPGDVKGDGMRGVWHAVRTSAPRAAAPSYDSGYYYKY